jgi:putative FmdB family regulatory protein
MPIYEYECMNCGKQCEVIQKFNDEPLSTCPECGGHMHKLVSQTSFILKGTGWYVTDYASSTRKKAMEAEGKSSPVSEKKPGGKKESKHKTAAKQ